MKTSIATITTFVALLVVFTPYAGAQIQESTVVSKPVVCFLDSEFLSFGQSGGEVEALQHYLIEKGFLKVEATGYFGVQTRAALVEFQLHNKIISSREDGGDFGKKTQSFVLAECGSLITLTGDQFGKEKTASVAVPSSTSALSMILAPATSSIVDASKIIKTSSNFAANHDAAKLFDECLTATSGCSVGSDRSESFWIEFDLGTSHTLTQARLHGDESGRWVSKTWSLEVKGESGVYKPVFTDKTAYGNKWFTQDINATGRYVRLTVKGNPGSLRVQASEFQLFTTHKTEHKPTSSCGSIPEAPKNFDVPPVYYTEIFACRTNPSGCTRHIDNFTKYNAHPDVKAIDSFMSLVSNYVDTLKTNKNAHTCFLEAMKKWSDAGALTETNYYKTSEFLPLYSAIPSWTPQQGVSADYQRMFFTSSIAAAYYKYKKSPYFKSSEDTQAIETWIETLALRSTEFISGTGVYQANRQHWAVFSALTAGVATDNQQLIDWAKQSFKESLSHIASDGTFPYEEGRENRVFYYSVFALQPLLHSYYVGAIEKHGEFADKAARASLAQSTRYITNLLNNKTVGTSTAPFTLFEEKFGTQVVKPSSILGKTGGHRSLGTWLDIGEILLKRQSIDGSDPAILQIQSLQSRFNSKSASSVYSGGKWDL